MSTPVTLVFESRLAAPPERLWAWMTDLRCIRREMMPLLAMTAPRGVHTLTDLAVEPGRRLFRSVLLLGGILPVDVSDLTLASVTVGRGFVERSPMLSMRLWEHRREVRDAGDGAAVLRDTLTFESRLGRRLATWVVRRLFTHRHRVLRRVHGTLPAAA